MARILFLAHRIPYPPNKGDKIRSWNILKHLCARHEVSLGCFVDDPQDAQYADVLRQMTVASHLAPLPRKWATLRSAKGLVTQQSLSVCYYDRPSMHAWVRERLEKWQPEAIYAFSSTMAQFALEDVPRGTRRLIDFVDVDSAKWRQYAREMHGPKALVYAREGKKLLEFEEKVAAAFDVSLFVSSHEAQLFKDLAPKVARKVQILENGVDTAFFHPQASFDALPRADTPSLVFTGAMDYPPNIDAVTWFADRVWPALHATWDGAEFFIVGGKPSAEVRALAAREGITVTGRVDDVRPHLAAGTIAVAPMRIARGIQNKVLEAMAMAKATVTTPQGFEGISAVPGRDIVVAESAEEMAETLRALLGNPERRQSLGENARRHVAEHYSWPAKLAALDRWLAPPAVHIDNDRASQAC